MSSIPFASFSAVKVHQTIKQQKERQKNFGSTQPTDGLQPTGNKYSDRIHLNYNSKYMNSVWGLYNKYAPQAFQKNEELLQRTKSATVSSNANVIGNGGAV